MFYAWQWEDEKGNYNPYSSTASLGLEEARSNKESTYDLEASHRSYRIDIAKLEQTNTTTDVVRKVSRAESSEYSLAYCIQLNKGNVHIFFFKILYNSLIIDFGNYFLFRKHQVLLIDKMYARNRLCWT